MNVVILIKQNNNKNSIQHTKHYVNVSVLIQVSQQTSIFTLLIIISSP